METLKPLKLHMGNPESAEAIEMKLTQIFFRLSEIVNLKMGIFPELISDALLGLSPNEQERLYFELKGYIEAGYVGKPLESPLNLALYRSLLNLMEQLEKRAELRYMESYELAVVQVLAGADLLTSMEAFNYRKELDNANFMKPSNVYRRVAERVYRMERLQATYGSGAPGEPLPTLAPENAPVEVMKGHSGGIYEAAYPKSKAALIVPESQEEKHGES